MNSNPSSPLDSKSTVSYFLLAGIVFVAVLAWFSISYLQSDKAKKADAIRQLEEQKQAEEKNLEEQRFAEQEARRNASVQGRKSNWTRFDKKNEELLTLLANADVLNKKRIASENVLLDTPKGRFLATDDAERNVFIGIREKLAEATAELEQWQISATSYDATISQMMSLAAPESDVSSEDFAKATGLVERVNKLTTELTAANKYLEGLIAKSDSTSSGTGSLLREQIADIEAARLARNVIERQKEVQQVLDQEEAKLRELLKSQELTRKEKERELLQIQFDLEMKQKEKDIEAARIAAKKELDDLENANLIAAQDQAMKSDIKKIESVLQPFTSKAKAAFTSRGNTTLQDDEKPVSLSALEGFGALEQTESGYTKLLQAALACTANNQRPLGGFSTDIHDFSKAADAQRLLRTHGQAMVRAGLLEK